MDDLSKDQMYAIIAFAKRWSESKDDPKLNGIDATSLPLFYNEARPQGKIELPVTLGDVLGTIAQLQRELWNTQEHLRERCIANGDAPRYCPSCQRMLHEVIGQGLTNYGSDPSQCRICGCALNTAPNIRVNEPDSNSDPIQPGCRTK